MLLPEQLDDYVTEDNPVRVVDVFVEQLDLGQLGFEGVDPSDTADPLTIPQSFLSSTSTATSTASNPVDA